MWHDLGKYRPEFQRRLRGSREQIEHAGATALAVRGNFDYSANETGDTDHGREPALESAQFPMVTTDNQEIVTYALVSNTAPAGTAPNTQSVTMYVDVNSGGAPARVAHPGGSAENLKTIPGVDLTNANPPYTLYRFSFADDGGVQRTALADNIRSLNFFYFEDPSGQRPLTDAAGAFLPNIGGVGQYDPTVAGSINAPGRQIRKKIRAIRDELPFTKWETAARKAFRIGDAGLAQRAQVSRSEPKASEDHRTGRASPRRCGRAAPPTGRPRR